MNIKQLALAITIFSFWRAIPLLPTLSTNIYYLVLGGASFITIISDKNLNLKRQMVLFLILCFLSLIMNTVPIYFKAWERLISFVLVLITTGPILFGKYINTLKLKIFHFINIGLVGITLVSLLSFLLKLPFAFGNAGFQGLTNQSMMLGPMAAFAAIFSLHLYFNNFDSTQKTKLIYLGLIVACVLTSLAAGSRGALGSMLVAFLFYLFKKYKNNLGQFIKIGLTIIFICAISYPLWMPYTEMVQKKQENAEKMGSIYASREDIWEDRINEFKYSPYIGVGFASMHPEIAKSHFDKKTGNLEPGSGWLFLLSSVGLFTALIFLFLIGKPIIQIIKSKDNSSDKILVGSLLCFFFVHLFFEGYILASGSFLFIYLWLCISLAQDEINYLVESLQSKTLF